MKMDGGTLMVLILTVGFLMVPFVLDLRRRRRIGSGMLRELRIAAHKQGGVLHKYEICGQIVLGLDKMKKGLFFLNKRKGEENLQHVDLTQVRSARVDKSHRAAKNMGSDGPAECVDLVLERKDGGEVRLALYRDKMDASLSSELKIAEKWTVLVNRLLRP